MASHQRVEDGDRAEEDGHEPVRILAGGEHAGQELPQEEGHRLRTSAPGHDVATALPLMFEACFAPEHDGFRNHFNMGIKR